MCGFPCKGASLYEIGVGTLGHSITRVALTRDIKLFPGQVSDLGNTAIEALNESDL